MGGPVKETGQEEELLEWAKAQAGEHSEHPHVVNTSSFSDVVTLPPAPSIEESIREPIEPQGDGASEDEEYYLDDRCRPLVPQFIPDEDCRELVFYAERGRSLRANEVLKLLRLAEKGHLPVCTLPPWKPRENRVYVMFGRVAFPTLRDGHEWARSSQQTLPRESAPLIRNTVEVTVQKHMRRKIMWELDRSVGALDLVVVQYTQIAEPATDASTLELPDSAAKSSTA
jgi:hypothetical protein